MVFISSWKTGDNRFLLITDMSSSGGRVAIITGSASGIGRSIAIRLGRDGYNVVISELESKSDRMEEVRLLIANANKEKGERRSIIVSCDVSKEDDVQRLVEKAVSTFGRLDVVSVVQKLRVEI